MINAEEHAEEVKEKLINDLINHTCIMKPPLKTKPNKRTRFREFSGWWIYRNLRRMEHLERAWVLCTLSPCLTLCISSNWMCLSYILLWYFFILLLVSFLISGFPNKVIWSIPEPQWESGSGLQVYKEEVYGRRCIKWPIHVLYHTSSECGGKAAPTEKGILIQFEDLTYVPEQETVCLQGRKPNFECRCLQQVWSLFVGTKQGGKTAHAQKIWTPSWWKLLKSVLGKFIGCLISLWVFFWLVAGEITGWCFRNLHHQPSGSSQSGSSACGQCVVTILHWMGALHFCSTTQRQTSDCYPYHFRQN